MRKILSASLLLFFSLGVYAQNDPTKASMDTSERKFIRPSDPTGFGTPDGQLVSKEIGPGGGTIASDDGRVELIFPADALTANTMISIQPTTNLATNGVGKSYRFEPSGTQFKRPVTIFFHYTEDEAKVCPPDWMILGIQDDTGKWTIQEYEEFDSVLKTLKGKIHHFSLASNLNAVELRPSKESIPVNGTSVLQLVDVSLIQQSDFFPATFLQQDRMVWYVNDVLNGDDKNGKLSIVTASLGKTLIVDIEYKAPAIMPKKNPVEVWGLVGRRTKKDFDVRFLRCFIEVFDAYRVTLTHRFEGRAGMGSVLEDKASFVMKLFPRRMELSEIINFLPRTITEGTRARVNEKIYVDGAPGTINIENLVKNYSVDFTVDPPQVYFEFGGATVLNFTLQYVVRHLNIETDRESISCKAVPESLGFDATGRRQQFTHPDYKKLDVVIDPCAAQFK